MTDASSRGPLDGLVVLDLSVALAGPLVTFNLAGLGATVIKVESPGGSDIGRNNPPYLGSRGVHNSAMEGDDISVSMMDRARGKSSITIDLKTERGREIFLALAEQADVVIENMSLGTVDRLGVGFDAVRAVNPGVVYCSITAFGGAETYRDIKGMDILIQAASGLMASTGFADGPPVRVGIPVGDIVGSLYASVGILAAIRERDRTGVGQRVDISLLDTLAALVAEEHFDADPRPAEKSMRSGNSHDRLAPFGSFAAADGHVALAASADHFAHALFRAIGRADLIDDPRFAGRGARSHNSDELNAILSEWFGARTVTEILTVLRDENGVAVVEVLDPRDAVRDPDLLRSGAVTTLEHPTLGADYGTPLLGSGLPIRFSESRVDVSRPAPLLGADTDATLQRMLGLTPDELDELHRTRVI
jgi:crotonobetainyl-CoA:carnitine CoA-transferase CaiB-like acyl-CoA transferase